MKRCGSDNRKTKKNRRPKVPMVLKRVRDSWRTLHGGSRDGIATDSTCWAKTTIAGYELEGGVMHLTTPDTPTGRYQ